MANELLRRGMYGFAMGDAFGVPYEFNGPDAQIQTEMQGGGGNDQLPGTWSDDTSLNLATITALTGEYDLKAIMQNFDDYLYDGQYTPDGTAFGYGDETAAAIKYFHETGKYGDFGLNNPLGSGNGALMRIWPLAFYSYPAQMTLEQVVDEVTGLTHGQMRSKLASRFFVYFIRVLARRGDSEKAILQAIRAINRQPAVQTLLQQEEMGWLVTDATVTPNDIVAHIKEQKSSELATSGYVLDTLNVVLWASLNYQDYTEAVLSVVQLGGDTDTNAALVGLAFSYIDNDFSDSWLETLRAKNKIESVLILADEAVKFD
ncbi:ADP-ribosylglycohydrolase [Weissella viridescens]|uniref:ADP-ribosylglycohydrolase n=1 Tax=Weissella viridescens TaxID=1629 RepID=A0A3P2REF4_WEIVI|nr:ADP-ribosylglycohydrolase family protein [Weissella viridescens]RRG17795.1 ADP-ribosylglycohydrolase [Weissella viridescens]